MPQVNFNLWSSTLKKVTTCLFLLGVACQAAPKFESYVRFVGPKQVSPLALNKTIELTFRVDEKFHIQANPASSPQLIPTVLTLEATSGIEFKPFLYPQGKPLRVLGIPDPIQTYSDSFKIRVPVSVVAKSDFNLIRGSLHYQACDKTTCFPPRDLKFQINLSDG